MNYYTIFIKRSGEVLHTPFMTPAAAHDYMRVNHPEMVYVVRDRVGREVGAKYDAAA